MPKYKVNKRKRMTDIYGGNSNTQFTEGIQTGVIDDLDPTNDLVRIDLTVPNTINLIADTVMVNGEPIGGGGGGNVFNPLTENLSIGAFNITGLSGGQTVNSISTKTLANEEKTVNITSTVFPTNTSMQGNLRVDNIATDQVSDSLATSFVNMTVGAIELVSDNLNVNLNLGGATTFNTSVEAGSFIKTGGTNEQYLMANGSTLTASANSGNSNYYLYNNNTSLSPTPSIGNITFNNASQEDATMIYISHRTRDNIDIEVFFNQLSTLTDVYLQDQNTSLNFIQYNIIGTPTIVAEAQVSIPVLISNSGGTGTTNFPNGHNILCAFFTNTLETDQRISNVEFKTQYILSVFGSQTNFGGTVTAGTFEATNIKKTGGLATQFLKANGSIDSTTYLDTAGGEVFGTLTVNNVVKQGIANIDWGGSIDRPYLGIQFVHSAVSLTTLSTLPFSLIGTVASSGFSSINNITRQLCCVTTSPSVNSDGSAGGYIATNGSGGQVSMGSSFGLYASFAITDTGINLNNCQNFIGLYSSYSQINLNQTNQLSTYRNIIAFGSDTNDPNICIYTASSTATFKQVDLGASFPANVIISGGTNWYKLALWWDGDTKIFYKCVNTTTNVTVSGSFAPALNAYPADSVNLTPQILRIQGTPQSSNSGKLRIQRFGVF